MNEYDYLVDQITKRVKGILSEATYYDSPFQELSISIVWRDEEEPRIDYWYTKGGRDNLHRTPEEYEEEK